MRQSKAGPRQEARCAWAACPLAAAAHAAQPTTTRPPQPAARCPANCLASCWLAGWLALHPLVAHCDNRPPGAPQTACQLRNSPAHRILCMLGYTRPASSSSGVIKLQDVGERDSACVERCVWMSSSMGLLEVQLPGRDLDSMLLPSVGQALGCSHQHATGHACSKPAQRAAPLHNTLLRSLGQALRRRHQHAVGHNVAAGQEGAHGQAREDVPVGCGK